MKAVSVTTIKKELQHYSNGELIKIMIRLSTFKKENKELLTYLLFEAEDQFGYINSIKNHMDQQFDSINTKSYFYIRKSVRKILRETKKFIRYTQNKETEIELLLYFCQKLKGFKPSISRSQQLTNMYNRQLDLVRKIIPKLHEDLQYDYNLELENFH